MKKCVSVVGFVVLASIAMGIGACSTNEIVCYGEPHPWDVVLEESITGYQDEMECVTPVYLVSPIQCMPPSPSGPRMSKAQGGDHARKLYHLFVSDRDCYQEATNGLIENSIGLTLVKEAHALLSVNDLEFIMQGIRVDQTSESKQRGEPMAMPGEVDSLFIMSKVGDVDTPGTDRGWVYGGATPDGTVYAVGSSNHA